MRMRRAHHDGIGLAGKIEIVAKAALAGQQRRIFLADDGPADAAVR